MENIREVYRELLSRIINEKDVIPPSMKWKTIDIKEYFEIYNRSLVNYYEFWEREARVLRWARPWSRLIEDNPPRTRWFVGGWLSPYYNIIGRHRDTWIWSKPALIWEGEEGDARVVTYSDLDRLVDKIAYALLSDVRQGEWVIIYAPPMIETIAIALAAVKIGVAFEPVFTGFGSWELARRIKRRRARVVFTVDSFYRRGRIVDVLGKVRNAIELIGRDVKVVVVNRVSAPSNKPNELLLDDYVSVNKGVDEAVVSSLHPIHGLHPGYRDDYKPITHPAGGYLVQVYSTSRWIGLKPRDTYFCTVWPGWITNSSYVVIGPLMIGSTVLLYDGGPDYPSWDRWLGLIEDYAVTLFLTTSTALKLISKYISDNALTHRLDTLRAILVTAELLDVDTWWWTYRYLGTGHKPMIDSNPQGATGRIPVVNMYIQSEIGSFVTGNLIDYTFPPLRPGSTGTPIPGFDLALLSDTGEVVESGYGELVVRKPWPAMPIEYPDDFQLSWQNGYYRTRDYAYIHADRYVYVAGRLDGVYKSSGYRLSPGAIVALLREYKIESSLEICFDDEKYQDVVVRYYPEGDVNIVQLIRDKLGPIQTPRIVTPLDRQQRDQVLYIPDSDLICCR